jgi:hypothetical protein
MTTTKDVEESLGSEIDDFLRPSQIFKNLVM